MNNEQLARKAATNIVIIMGIKWAIIIGMNRSFRKAAARAAAKASEVKP